MANRAKQLRRGIQDLPGNEIAYGRLRRLMDAGNAIAFVGAGASVPLYLPWPRLILRLAEEAVCRGRATEADRDHWLKIAEMDPQQAVHGIKQKLGKQQYWSILAWIYGRRRGTDDHFYTPAHSALVRMPFAGYVTTNFDTGLLEARRDLRPDASATGFATWKDTDSVMAWLTDGIFDAEDCPVLYAHGIHDRSDTIVLDTEEYEAAYASRPYRQLFESLWVRNHLVFVGFGFADRWFSFIAREIIAHSAFRAPGEPRHVAILGLPENEQYTPEMRNDFVDSYNAEPLYYRVRELENHGQDHGDLLTILETLTIRRDKVASSPNRSGGHASRRSSRHNSGGAKQRNPRTSSGAKR